MKKNYLSGFTLTEVLVAVVIVGVIAALVLPSVISHYQEKSFDRAFQRETQSIQSAVEGLAVNENKASFFETMMYTTEEPATYTDSAEKFIKAYLRPSKLCGDNNGDCFAKTYYNYKDDDKKVYTPEYKGSCAKLKNGASICLTTQTGGQSISGLIDINGEKSPNVLNKDLRTFTIEIQTQAGRKTDLAIVRDYTFNPIQDEEDPCEGMTCGCGSLQDCEPECSSNSNEWDLTCCQKNSSSITSSSHHCCTFDSLKNSAACSDDYKVYFHCAIVDTLNPDYDENGDKLYSYYFGYVPQNSCWLKVETSSQTLAQWIEVQFGLWYILGCEGSGCSANIDEFDGGSGVAALDTVSGGDTVNATYNYYQLHVPKDKIGTKWWDTESGICKLQIKDSSTGNVLKSVEYNGLNKVSDSYRPSGSCKSLYTNFVYESE